MALQPLPKSSIGQALRSGQTNLVQRVTSTAPINGLVSQKPIAAMTPQDALQLRNFWVKPYGLELRPGYRIHQNTLNDPVNTLMPYEARFPGDSKLFAVTFQGIYDVTSRQDNPVQPPRDVTFSSQIPGTTDTLSWIQFNTLGENFLCVVGETNGYWTFSTSTGWVQHDAGVAPGDIDGTDPLPFDYITSWKRRLWFVKTGETKAFYLPVNQIAGEVEEFDFGPYMRQGGTVQQLVSWTRDGGDGLDDFLIVIGSQGDVISYQGTDPANADTFAMVGIWDVGRVPDNRRIAMKSGGDVQVLCETGVIPLSELFSGALKFGSVESMGFNIQTILARKLSANLDEPQWEILYYPREEQVMIKEPVTINEIAARIWTASVHNDAWSQLVNLPIQTMVVFESTMFGSDQDGNVYELFIGNSDNVGFDGLPNEDLVGQVQTGFTNYDMAELKRCQLVEPVFQGSSAPGVQVIMRSEFDFNVLPGSPQFFAPNDGSFWDVDFWDQAFWSGSQNTYMAWAGSGCLGRYMSLFLSVRGPARLVFTHWTLSFETGGLM